MSSFTGIDVTSIVGDALTGVQARFPKFIFDEKSRPTIQQVQKYAASAINNVSRQVRFKGYDPADISDPNKNPSYAEDLLYIADWIELAVCAEISTTLDQFKDSRSANLRLEQLSRIEKQFSEVDDPFPTCPRRTVSEVQTCYPSHVVRVLSRDVNQTPDPLPPIVGTT